ncbi:acyl carrier protein [Streptomyces sedi]|uniref:Acyl carrier protein n=1 Tax=Streptomyces sedi TaxID=555059 RepID=A0A5C4UQ13_9ACTN|nr:acyl carrier protein [Streptomyces sedi]TNM25751.1 acyl carrier protein [Streptomyces sedi]
MTETTAEATDDRSAAGVGDWLTRQIADFAEVPADSVAADRPLTEYGIDSVSGLAICARIEDHYDLDIDPTLLWDAPTVEALTDLLRDELAARG